MSLVDLVGHVRGHMTIEMSSETSFEGYLQLDDQDNLVSERISSISDVCEQSYVTDLAQLKKLRVAN